MNVRGMATPRASSGLCPGGDMGDSGKQVVLYFSICMADICLLYTDPLVSSAVLSISVHIVHIWKKNVLGRGQKKKREEVTMRNSP